MFQFLLTLKFLGFVEAPVGVFTTILSKIKLKVTFSPNIHILQSSAKALAPASRCWFSFAVVTTSPDNSKQPPANLWK